MKVYISMSAKARKAKPKAAKKEKQPFRVPQSSYESYR